MWGKSVLWNLIAMKDCRRQRYSRMTVVINAKVKRAADVTNDGDGANRCVVAGCHFTPASELSILDVRRVARVCWHGIDQCLKAVHCHPNVIWAGVLGREACVHENEKARKAAFSP